MALIDTATSETLSARSAHARHRSAELRQRSQELLVRNAALLARSLDQLTEIADMEGEAFSPQRADRLRQLSERVGRDPAIERAKMLMRERYGINGAEAFDLLRHISQNRNRKIRDIAREMVTRAERTARADRSRHSSRPETKTTERCPAMQTTEYETTPDSLSTVNDVTGSPHSGHVSR